MGWAIDIWNERIKEKKVLPTFLNYCHYSIYLEQLENLMFVLLELLKLANLPI